MEYNCLLYILCVIVMVGVVVVLFGVVGFVFVQILNKMFVYCLEGSLVGFDFV